MLRFSKNRVILLIVEFSCRIILVLFLVVEVYADPSYSSYEALRFVSGVSTTFTPGVRKRSCALYIFLRIHL